MKIRRLKIQKFGNLENRSLEFSPGINVLSGSDEKRKTVTAFLKEMLYGSQKRPVSEESYGGVLWFERGGEEFRLTRQFDAAKPYHELRSETSGAITDAERGSLSRVMRGLSEEAYDNAVEVQPLKSTNLRDTVREIQNCMSGYEVAGDRSLDLGRAEQMLKMSRKGYQAQEQRRIKELTENRQAVEAKMQELEGEMETYRSRMRALEEKEEKLNLGEEGSSGMEQKLQSIQTKLRTAQIAGILALIGCVLAAIVVPLDGILKILLVLAGVLFAGAAVSYRNYLRRDLNKNRKLAEKRAVRQDKMSDDKSEVERAFEECARYYVNLRGELREYDAAIQRPSSENAEVTSINLAMEIIGELSQTIYSKMNPALQRRMSVILKGISGGVYGTVHMNENLHMTVFSEGQEIALERLDREALEQIYFALCMAASELLCPQESIPVILDDVLERFAPEIVPGILKWMAQDPRQFVISTKSMKETEWLEQAGIAYQKL